MEPRPLRQWANQMTHTPGVMRGEKSAIGPVSGVNDVTLVSVPETENNQITDMKTRNGNARFVRLESL